MAPIQPIPRSAPPAVVVGLDSLTGLQVARIYAARGIRVVGIAEDRRHACCFTRRAARVVEAPFTEEGLLGPLTTLAAELGSGAVLIPCSDAAVVALSRLRDRLPAALRHGVPSLDRTEALLDKERFVDFALRSGLRVPRTRAVAAPGDARRALTEVALPCVAKPSRKSRAWAAIAGADAVVLRTVRELDALVDRVSGFGERWLLQEWVPGGDDAVYCSHTFHAASSQPLASSVVRKLRQWPPGAGVTTLAVHVSAPEIDVAGRDALARNGWSGLCELEWKRHAATGELYAIEANPARASLNLPLVEASGVEIVMRAYRDAAGFPPPTGDAPRYGTRWIWWRADRASAAHYRRSGELAFGAYLRSIGGATIEAELSWSDPMPFLVAAARGVLRRLDAGPRATRASPNRSTALD